ncbi:MAG: serine/threonine-protein kinase [Myxococcota bacterium]
MPDRTLDDDSEAETAIVGSALPRPVPSDAPSAAAIGRYRVTGQLGVGGMGRVLRAHDPTLDRDVALKVLRVQSGTRPNSAARARLVREAQALAQLSHPNVAEVFDVETSEDQVYIAMELLEGETLGQWLKPARTAAEVCAVYEAAGRGLAAAHEAGLVHRDFKPANVMVGAGRVRVLDFGLVRGLSEGGPSQSEGGPLPEASGDRHARVSEDALTQAGAVMGTPAYMAPEQHIGGGTDARTDQFAFCVSLFEALAGSRPFSSVDLETLLDQKLHCDLQTRLPATVPRALRQAIVRGLSPKKADRFPTMAPLLDLMRPRFASSRARWVGGVGALVAVAGAATWSVGQASSPCAQVAETAVWTDDKGAAVRQAMRTADPEGGEAAFASADAALAAYSNDWVAARLALCHSATEQSEGESDRRLACLETQRRTASALVSILTDVDGEVLPRATKAIAALPPVAKCDSGRGPASEAASEMDDDPETESIRQEIARSLALEMSGQYEEAAASAEVALAAARATDYERLVGEASFRLGRAQGYRGLYIESERALREAYVVAVRAADHFTAFRAADSLVFIVGDPQGRYLDALEWAEHAQREQEHLPPDPVTDAMLLHSIGLTHARNREHEKALDYLQRAIEAMGDYWGFDDPRLGIPYNNLGNSLIATEQYDAALDVYVSASVLVREHYGADHPQLAVALSNVGNARMHVGDMGGAVVDLERALEICLAGLRPQHLHVANSQFQLGKVLEVAGRDEEAIEHLEAAVAIFSELEGYASYTAPLVALGKARLSAGFPRDAASVLNRALTIEEEKADDDRDPEFISTIAMTGARAVWAVGDDPTRARALARRAKKARDAAGQSADDIDRWLEERAPSG